jgi:hypothetical protein
MTTTQHDLADSFRRLTTRLAEVDDTDPNRAAVIRARLAAYHTDLAHQLDEKVGRCERHPWSSSFNCTACRSEQLGGIEPDYLTPAQPEREDHR